MGILTGNLYSPQSYLDIVTDKYYTFRLGSSVKSQVESILRQNELENLRSYLMQDIGPIVMDNVDVVLVDMSDYNTEKSSWENQYMWYEVPSNCIHKLSEEDYV